MADETKPWWKSKTIISDVVTAIVGIYVVIQPILNAHGLHLPGIEGGLLGTILGVLAGLGIYGRTTATLPVK